MRRTLFILLAVILVLGLTAPGCRGGQTTTTTTTPTTTAPLTTPTGTITPTGTTTPTTSTTVPVTTATNTTPATTTPTVTTTAPSPTYTALSASIAAVNPVLPASLAPILGAAQDIEKAEEDGSVSGDEAGKLKGELGAKFNGWIKATVDGIDPVKPESIKDFFDLQAVQRTPEYDELVDGETKEYKEEQMKEKFNDWVRNRVDEIDPADADNIKYFFWLQNIQACEKYDELATPETHDYKEQQMEEKFNEWVRARVDEIDPAEEDNLKFFFWLQNIQACEKYEKFASPETHDYKEAEMKRKFNEWVENRVNDLDPEDPDFLEKLEMLRVLQLSDKYELFILDSVHQWKEQQLAAKVGAYVSGLLAALNPLATSFMADIARLIEFQATDIYRELCPPAVKLLKQDHLKGLFTVPPGPPPGIAAVYPEHAQTGVAADQPLVIVFNQPMDLETLAGAIEISGQSEFAAVALGEEPFIVMFQPQEALEPGAVYTVTVSPLAMSAEGAPLLETFEFSFTTATAGPAPRVVSALPVDGEVGDMAGQPVVLTFDRPMNTASVENALTVSPGFACSVVWSQGNTVSTIQSHQPLVVNTVHTVTVGTSALSFDGVALGEVFELSFMPSLMARPHVLGDMVAASGGTIPTNYPIQLVFDLSMDTASVEGNLRFATGFAYTVEWFEADTVMQIVPAGSLVPGGQYSITILAGALSSFGLPMAESYTFEFSVRGG
ncbi:MAG: Ig-like domain-containing protein [Dehalococcoidaceae bacterium]|nr:Ig-like domain-containing protein [Dehalococcoidaceae bacterium]